MANKILAALNYSSLHQTLKENGMAELKKFNWNDAADNVINVYNEAIDINRKIPTIKARI
jgi:glycosyltransferase involved in cell wall biosynthesis